MTDEAAGAAQDQARTSSAGPPTPTRRRGASQVRGVRRCPGVHVRTTRSILAAGADPEGPAVREVGGAGTSGSAIATAGSGHALGADR